MSSPVFPAEYRSHATLMLLGDDLDPTEVSRAIRMRPSQSWSRGDPQTSVSASRHEYGGWKKFLPVALTNAPLERQLAYWAKKLLGQGDTLNVFVSRGYVCALNCYIGIDATASVVLPSHLLMSLASLGVELRLSCIVIADDA
jgi:Domain of unknown function (DUF4279)